jgi:hypothetical protein
MKGTNFYKFARALEQERKRTTEPERIGLGHVQEEIVARLRAEVLRQRIERLGEGCGQDGA